MLASGLRMMSLIRHAAPHCAVVEGLPLWDATSEGMAAELRALLAETGVVVLRRQALDEDELVRAAAMFGTLEASLRYDWASPTNRQVGYISNLRDAAGRQIGGLGSNEVAWHCDQSYIARPATAIGIDGLPAPEAERLLAELCEHATQPRFLYTHSWQIGDVVVWDNAVTLHRREPFDPHRPRLLKRLQFRLPRQEFICPD
jgi:alpha-ketoglutarate-dependent taurine dioxygenase